MRMQQGKKYVVYCYIDTLTSRIVASAKVEKFFSKEPPLYQVGDTVEVMIQQKTDLGFKVIVEGRYGGLIYQNELFRDIHTGDILSAYVKTIRPDGKLDITLQHQGMQHVVDFSEQLYLYLQKDENGFCPYHDKSPAEDIYSVFKVSKKTFKKAVGDLYKRNIIVLKPDGLYLTDQGKITGIIED